MREQEKKFFTGLTCQKRQNTTKNGNTLRNGGSDHCNGFRRGAWMMERVLALLEVSALPPRWHADIYGTDEADAQATEAAGTDVRGTSAQRGLADLAALLAGLVDEEHLPMGATPRTLLPPARLAAAEAVERSVWATLNAVGVHPTALVAFLYRELVAPASGAAQRDACTAYLCLLILDGTPAWARHGPGVGLTDELGCVQARNRTECSMGSRLRQRCVR
jgi:hypothetical protein